MIDLADALVIKDGNVFMVTPRDGRLGARGGHPFGLWLNDCRFLHVHELTVDGEAPVLVASSDAAGAAAVVELAAAQGGVRLRILRKLDPRGVLHERITVERRRGGPAAVRLAVRLGADFLPMLELRGLVARQAREVEATSDGFAVVGRDGIRRSTRVRADPEPSRAGDGSLVFHLEPSREASLTLELELDERGPAATPAAVAAPPAPGEPATVTCDDELLDAVLQRSLGDLRMLRSELDGHAYYAAGVPWFATLFGRDSLIAALQSLAFAPEVAESTLRLLAAKLGTRVDDARDEEPGKVVHELRVGEPAALGESPFGRYYGSVDATLLFLCALCAHADWTCSLDLFHELGGAVEAALAWIDDHGDLDGDGLLEYRRRAPHGLETQSWKDSPGGMPDDHGRPLAPPVAPVEAQGYAVRAKRELARLFALDGDDERAARLRREAAELAGRLERFWVEDARCYALGLDADKRRGAALSSNQGHLLWSGALDERRARSVRDAAAGPELFSGWGVRTLGRGNPAYDPLGYHTGSVWPHDCALIAAGLRRYGFDEEFLVLLDGVLAAAARFGDRRLPELFGGFAREQGAGPVPYPLAARPQAWAAGSVPYLVTSALGLRPDALNGRLEVVRPLLPAGTRRLELNGLRVGGARLDLAFDRRADGAVRLAQRGGASSTKISKLCSGSNTIWL